MKDIKFNRFLVWLLFVPVIAITGWFSLFVWTLIQIFMYCIESEQTEERSKPLHQRKDVVELNKKENLTEAEKEFLRNNPCFIKTSKGVFIFDRDKL